MLLNLTVEEGECKEGGVVGDTHCATGIKNILFPDPLLILNFSDDDDVVEDIEYESSYTLLLSSFTSIFSSLLFISIFSSINVVIKSSDTGLQKKRWLPSLVPQNI